MEAAVKHESSSPDIILLFVTLVLITIGTTMIYSSSSIIALEKFSDSRYFIKKQIVFVFMGMLLMVLMTKIPYEHLKKLAYPGILLAIILLVLVLVPGFGIKSGGAMRWLNVGGVSFQVTEMVKIAMVLFLSCLFARKTYQLKNFNRGILLPLIVTVAIVILILLEPDFGAAVIIATIFLFMLCVAGARIRHLLFLSFLFVPAAVMLIFLKGYRLTRLTTFLDPWKDPSNTGWQIVQSLISFGSGGTFGVGIGEGMQKLFYLPEPHTDFILAIIAEESGFLGVSIVIAMFAVFALRGFMIAMKAPDFFGTLLAAGLTLVIALQAIVNIAGVMGLIPLKGLVLPFLSYGGTAFMMSMASVGILLNISSQTA
ncbi:MAG TPA: putative lipid II flippase FtsW [Deltaproteobacteria bacterium]|nr:putative lipid II flippase FtsW [Deltaproteobacteria bacterium]